ncbi:MAG: hypothetical protein IPP94_04115 [Ignavibacteria bacterium]|nr:hypothetical protein [Ignavibacteria bacterium]
MTSDRHTPVPLRRIRRATIPVALVAFVMLLSSAAALRAQNSPGKAAGSAHRTFDIECATCHTTDGWKSLKKAIVFDHKLTGYLLTGEHANVKCESCHATIPIKDLKPACAVCHADQHKGQFGDQCQSCHTPAGWRAPNAEIAKHMLTRFPLLGAHRHVECRQCHSNQSEKEYVNTPIDCYACHREAYEATGEPDHALGNFDHNCTRCHDISAEQWTGSFVHPFFPAKDAPAHIGLECRQCHKTGYAGTPTDCYGCHKDAFAATTAPNHLAGNFDHDCTVCHEPVHWKPAKFDHARTQFPLTGAHATTACNACHTKGYTALPKECWACHQSDYQGTTFPNHAQGQLDHACETCHNTTAWKPAKFNHENTNFRLTGAHQRTECQKCHVGGKFKGLPIDCQGCHTQTYQQTARPNHQLVGFSLLCQDCHNTNAWQPADRMPATINHDLTRFPLQGKHQTTPCERCHVNLVFRGTPQECYACHEKDFTATKNPDHLAGMFNHDCKTCHTLNGWKPATFDHNATAFPLQGKHTTVLCEKCHVNGNYTLKYVDCWQCHQNDFTLSKQPDHVLGQLPHECITCHTVNGWKPSTFDHNTTRFRIEGAHRAVDCAKCHVNGQYKNLAMDCWSCHQKDYTAVTQPSHVTGQFNHDCTTCHSLTAWKPATFDHNATRFRLEGGHRTVECAKCHVNGQYTNLSMDCWSCHQKDFNAVAQPSHVNGQFNHDCTTCHTVNAWKPSTFDHAATRFPLQGAHKRSDCQSCHIGGKYTNMPVDCWSCHQTKYEGVVTPNHVNGQFNRDCTICHGLEAWKPTMLDHSKTNFPLTGKHLTAPCEQCHKNGQYGVSLPTDCWSCHQTNYQQSTQPAHVTAQFPHDCAQCHTTNAWKPSTFDHATTKFPLDGAHRAAPCQDCHIAGNYSLQYTDCWQCHQKDFNGTQQPNHAAGQFSHDCTTCHSVISWKPAVFNHATTKFPLEGKHQTVPCERCHTGGNYNLQYTDCWQCHQTDFNAVQTPNHATSQFPRDCTQCHSMNGWKPSTFDHNATKFALAGAHAAQPCQSCHVNGNYALQYVDCWQCHQTDFTTAKNPDHAAGSLPHDCATCHGSVAWKPSTFNHTSTKFPLEGRHVTTPCEKCHTNGNYTTLAYTDCYQCHQTQYNGVTNPNHLSGKFAHDCSVCHSSTAWKPSRVDHSKTDFPLTGKHITTPCEQCHTNGNYAITYTDCYACHAANFNGVTSPNHLSGKFSHNCDVCHSTSAWKPSSVDHNKTAFPLTGKHITTPCERCHVNGNYAITYTDCKQCHAQDFSNAKNPDHTAGKFSNDCAQCHSATTWKPSTFNHASTKLPLQGAHIPVPCQNCHVNGNYALVYTDCYQCHQTQFNNAQSPSHSAGKFGHDCLQCHTMTGWKPSTFNHATTKFPLTGAHIATPCQNCHINGNYTLTYTDCWQCHQTNFNQAQNPSHVNGKFPHDCTACHNTTTFKPSTFSHAGTAFPLQGAHTAVPCQNCHVNGNYTLTYTDCWQCHQSTFTNTTNPNHATGNFPHACLSCHTQAQWRPATFDHATTNFPLQGAHVSRACQDCHVNGNYQLTYTDCFMCHQTTYNGATNPNHSTNQFPHACLSCHTQSAWQPSTFNHSSTNFALTGAHLAQPCNACHTNGNYTLTYTDCWQCHQSDFNGATSPNHSSNQFSHNCTTCHTTSAWTPSTFNHNNTAFPLVGAHVNKACNLCHTNGNYQLTFTSCYTCHTSDFTGATSPANHVSMNLSHTCTTCHTQTAWSPATPFRTSHNVNAPNGFPIYPSSKHNYGSRWNTCNQCHTSNNTATFCCTNSGCHSNQSSLANDHNGVSGYSFSCTSCANTGCHPDGREP